MIVKYTVPAFQEPGAGLLDDKLDGFVERLKGSS